MNMSTTEEKLSFIRGIFGKALVSNDGVNIQVKCPECGDGSKKKFNIRLDSDLCHCFVCGLKGKNLAYIIKKHFPRDHVEYMTRFLKVDMAFEGEVKKNDNELRLPDDFVMLVDDQVNLKDPDIKGVLSYLKKRNITNRDMWYFKFGVSFRAGNKRRVVFPSYDSEGHLNFFTARDIDNNRFPKYLNAAVDKRQIIFNELNINWKDEITLVEGPFDLTKCNDNATCLLGSFLSRESRLFQQIIENKTPVLLALDPDAKEKTIKIAKSLVEYDVPVRMLDHGEFEDVGNMSKKEFEAKRTQAKPWGISDGLLAKIQNISAGCII